MFRHYLKTIWRNLSRQKQYYAIVIFGLTMGLTSCLFLCLWIHDEVSKDNFHQNKDDLYVVYIRNYRNGEVLADLKTQAYLPAELKNSFPQIKHASGFGWPHEETFQVDEKIVKLEGTRVSPEFFQMFDYPILAGDPVKALQDPSNIVISRKMAIIFFGNVEDALNKTIRVEDKKDVKVAAVFEDISNSSDVFDYVMNWQNLIDDNPLVRQWEITWTQTYIQLNEDVKVESLELQMRPFLDKYLPNLPKGIKLEVGLQKFSDKYLYSKFDNGYPTGGRIEYVNIFTFTAISILILSCINFVNLSTARALVRAKEVGIKKAIGVMRFQLAIQFFYETILLVVVASVIALLLVVIFLPQFNDLTEKQISIPLTNGTYWLILACVMLFTALLAGLYPAIHLSSMRPVSMLKGDLKTRKGGFRLRETLVVLQFAITVVFILTTFIVSMQTRYVQTKNVGFDRNNLVYIPMEDNLISKYQFFKSQVSQISGVKQVDRISQLPHDMGFKTIDIDWEGKSQDQIVRITPVSVGYDFASLMNLTLVDGRAFSREVASDQNNFIINETAVRDMKLQSSLGKHITLFGKKGEIIGVIKDFHFNSLHDPILPLIIDLKEELEFGTALVRIEDGKTASVLPQIQTIVKELNPTKTFTYSFADDEYLKLYKTEQLIEKLSVKFAILSVVLSCLGLFGLASFTVQQRTREVGIRKVMGASASSIVVLFSKYFMLLIAIALVIALPAGWYVTEKWLNGFSYRIDSTVSVYLLTILIVSGMAIITFCYHSIKASTTNPIKVIRTE